MDGGITIFLLLVLVAIGAGAAVWFLIFGGLASRRGDDGRAPSRAPEGPHPEQAARERSTLFPPAER